MYIYAQRFIKNNYSLIRKVRWAGIFRVFVFCPTYSEAWIGLSRMLLTLQTELPLRVLGVLPSLIDERFDHDSCGVGFVAAVDGAPDS